VIEHREEPANHGPVPESGRSLVAQDPGSWIVATTPADVEALRPFWEALGVGYVDADIDYFLTLVRARAEIERPYVIALGSSDVPRAFVVGRIEKAPFVSRLGYKTIYRPTLKTLRVAHGGVSGADDPRTARDVIHRVEVALASGDADVAIIPAVRIGSPLDRAANDIPGALRRGRFSTAAEHRRLMLPGTYDELLATRDKRSRYNLKRQTKLLANEFGERLAIRLLRGPEDFERVFDDLEHIASKTYQRGLGAGFSDTPERRELVRVAMERGWFRAWVMSVDDEPVAFWQGNVVGGTYYSSSTGYDPAYTKQGVGTILLLRLFEDLCADPDVGIVDFGWGDAVYKRRWANDSWQEHDVIVFAPTVRAVRTSLIRTGILATDRGARWLSDATRLTDVVKRAWRRRLREPAAPSTSGD
jgi:CelD/BcsL family acetyltransferase involved in cellulose biosynthesis